MVIKMTKKQMILSICTVMIMCISLIGVSKFLKVKDSDIKYASFYERAEEIDVLFYGSSIVHYGIYPMDLWNKYGITSYNMGNNSERLSMTYYTLLNSLDYAEPEVVVVDLGGLGWAGQVVDNTLKDHGYLDSVPLSINKIKTVNALFEKERRLEFLFPSVVYHSRWEEITIDDLKVEKNYLYGAEELTNVHMLEKPGKERYAESRYENFDFEAENLLKMKKLCEERGIQFVLIFMPYEVNGGDQKYREMAQEFTEQNDIVYYDLQELESIDWAKDFADQSHMNFNGAKKITSYLGEVLQQKHGIDNYKTQREYLEWEEAYQNYVKN